MLKVLDSNRLHLDRWLRWSSPLNSRDTVSQFIRKYEALESDNAGYHLGLWFDGKLSGGVVCWGIDPANQSSEIGYWLSASQTGKGYATRSSMALMEYLFAERNLSRIEMQCGVDNLASRAVAERCGLKLEGIRAQSHWITDRFVDHALYGIVRDDFTPSLTAG